jgi:hypothetical protein
LAFSSSTFLLGNPVLTFLRQLVSGSGLRTAGISVSLWLLHTASHAQRYTDRCLTHELVFFDVFLPEVILGMTHFFSLFFTFFQYLGKKRRKTPRYLRVFFSRVDSREICETKGKNASGIKTPEYSRPVVFFYKSSIWTLENIENVVSAVFYEKVSQI